MRRIQVTAHVPLGQRTCLGVWRHERNDCMDRRARWLYRYGDYQAEDWVNGDRLTHIGGPYFSTGERDWQYLFLFNDGSMGMCRRQHIELALATCGLQLAEGGE